MSATNPNYKPPNYDEMFDPTGDFRPLPPTHYELFGNPDPQDIMKGLKLYYSLTGDDYSNEPEHYQKYLRENVVDLSSAFTDKELKEIKETPIPYSPENETGEGYNDYATKYVDAFDSVDISNLYQQWTGGTYKKPSSFKEAKSLADTAFLDTLKFKRNKYEVGSAEWNELTELIQEGPMDFDNAGDFQVLQFGLGQNQDAQDAYRLQSVVMKNYLDDEGIDLFKEVEDERDKIDEDRVWLNTGTALPFYEDYAGSLATTAKWASTDLGSYGQWDEDPRLPTTAERIAGPLGSMMDIISVVYPPAASIAQGIKTYAYTEDFGDAFETGAKVYTGQQLAEIGNSELNDILKDAGIDISSLPEPVQEVVLDTTSAVVKGESGTDAFKESATGELLTVGKEMLPEVNIDLPDFETPQIVKDVGDVIVDVLEPPLEFVGETFEPVIEAGEQVLSTAEDVLEPVKEVVETVGEPIVDVVDEIIDAVDSPIGDALKQAVSGLGGVGGMMAGVRQPSQVEQIFDKELFKFDTEIKSTQEMLSPMMNLRRYG
jgi:hypothetical protein